MHPALLVDVVFHCNLKKLLTKISTIIYQINPTDIKCIVASASINSCFHILTLIFLQTINIKEFVIGAYFIICQIEKFKT